MRDRRRILPLLLFGLLAALACGSGGAVAVPADEPPPPVVAATRTRPTLPAEVSSYGNVSRLQFRTPEPTATPTGRPTPVWPTATAMPAPTAAGADGSDDGVEDYPAYCLTHYRQLLVAGAEARERFRPDDVYAVGLEFGRLRPDCVAQGFAPEPDFGLPCRTGWGVDGVEVSLDLLSRRGIKRQRELGPTGRDRRGNILVQYARLPYRDRAGCWYYDAGTRLWSWRIEPEGELERETGSQVADLTVCDRMLRERMAAGFDRLALVAGMVEQVLAVDEHCRGRGWRPYPQEMPPDDCGLEADRVWVYWHPEHRPYDGAACWPKPEAN